MQDTSSPSKVPRTPKPSALKLACLIFAGFILLSLTGFLIFKIVSSRSTPVADASSHTSSLPPSPATSSSDKEKTPSSSNSSDVQEKPQSPSENPDGKTPDKYEGNNPNSAESLTGSVSTARFSSDGKTLVIRVNIDQYLSSGSCHLVISDGQGTAPVEKSVEIVPEASTSTCAGFDISASELSALSRPLSITISLSSGAKTGSLEATFE
ncbi:hypothetical protein IJH89_00590 [Candidatus Saccharibacteria bacterium]|nr:hypothetical protein [Candidatus Saccharibacteria bacterium]